MGRLSGKKAFVTAAAQGIGRATALAFAAEGAEVFATDVNEAGLAGLPCRTARLDVLDAAAVAAAARAHGPADVLFNCAGIVHQGIDPGDHRGGPGRRLRAQRPRHVPHDPGLPARPCWSGAAARS